MHVQISTVTVPRRAISCLEVITNSTKLHIPKCPHMSDQLFHVIVMTTVTMTMMLGMMMMSRDRGPGRDMEGSLHTFELHL